MKVAGERNTKHLYEITEEDRKWLKEHGWEYVEEDAYGNEIWEQEINYDCIPEEEKEY